MADYDNTNRGVLFHESAPQSEKHPDYTGTINVDGKDYRLAGWKRTGKSGVPFLSLAISEPQKQSGYEKFKQQGQSLQSKKEVVLEDITDEVDLSEIPF